MTGYKIKPDEKSFEELHKEEVEKLEKEKFWRKTSIFS